MLSAAAVVVVVLAATRQLLSVHSVEEAEPVSADGSPCNRGCFSCLAKRLADDKARRRSREDSLLGGDCGRIRNATLAF